MTEEKELSKTVSTSYSKNCTLLVPYSCSESEGENSLQTRYGGEQNCSFKSEDYANDCDFTNDTSNYQYASADSNNFSKCNYEFRAEKIIYLTFILF